MRKSKFTESQIMAALKQFESGVPVNDVCRQVGVSPATFYKWKGDCKLNCVTAFDKMRQLPQGAVTWRSRLRCWTS